MADTQLVTIEDMAVDGAGVAHLQDGCVVFVDGAVVGDVAEIQLKRRNRRVAFATLVALQTPSVERVASRCDLLQCGGCPSKGTSYTLQASLKHKRVQETLRRVGGIDVDGLVQPTQIFGDGWAYRHRIRLHAQWHEAQGSEPGRFQLGYHQRHSHALVPLSTCPVAWPELERLGRAIAGGMAKLPRAAGLQTVELAYSRRDGRGGAKIVADGPVAAFRQSLEWVEQSELSGIEVVGGDGRFRWGNLELRYDHAHADSFDLRFEAGLFTQASVLANDALVAQVLADVQPRTGMRILELHAGIGNLSLPCARAGAQVTAVELQRRSAILLQRNARAAGVQIDTHAISDVEALPWLANRPDVLLLDPPRGGARALAEGLAAMGEAAPARIVYVSCDPATLARDAARIMAGPRRLLKVSPIDMFPQTPHIESVAVFA